MNARDRSRIGRRCRRDLSAYRRRAPGTSASCPRSPTTSRCRPRARCSTPTGQQHGLHRPRRARRRGLGRGPQGAGPEARGRAHRQAARR
ncbi:MAG: hypothetical protein MZW92_17330 [Comamonadaceae bacterium]|nr:hypothetical protein [Comamonadaceae bacterium]